MGLAGSTLNSSFRILEKEKRSNNIQNGNQKGRRITQSQVGEYLSRNWERDYGYGEPGRCLTALREA